MTMKLFTFISLILISLYFFSCSEETTKFEAVNPEAFAFDLSDEWEVNTSVVVKGFKSSEVGQKYAAKISFTVDLVTPEGVTKAKIADGIRDFSFDEKKGDVSLDSQFLLDSTYSMGNYKVIFNIKDEIGNQQTKVEKTFELSDED